MTRRLDTPGKAGILSDFDSWANPYTCRFLFTTSIYCLICEWCTYTISNKMHSLLWVWYSKLWLQGFCRNLAPRSNRHPFLNLELCYGVRWKWQTITSREGHSQSRMVAEGGSSDFIDFWNCLEDYKENQTVCASEFIDFEPLLCRWQAF